MEQREFAAPPSERHELHIDADGEVQAMHSDALMASGILPAGAITIGRLSQVEPIVLDGRITWCVTTADGSIVLATGFTERAEALKWERENFSALVVANGIKPEQHWPK